MKPKKPTHYFFAHPLTEMARLSGKPIDSCRVCGRTEGEHRKRPKRRKSCHRGEA